MNLLKFAVLLMLGLFLTNCSRGKTDYEIKGEIVGGKSDTLYLVKATDIGEKNPMIVPIMDNKFELRLNISDPEAYHIEFEEELLMSPEWPPVYFFPEKNGTSLKLFLSKEYNKNKVSGKLNKEFISYKKEVDSIFNPHIDFIQDSIALLQNNGNYWSPAMKKLKEEIISASPEGKKEIRRKINELEDQGNEYSEQTLALKKKLDKAIIDLISFQLNYVSTHHTIVSYYLLYDVLDRTLHKQDWINLSLAKDCYNRLSKEFANHPYNLIVGNLLKVMEQIRIGNKYVDFSAPDTTGKIIKLSEVIGNKVALIDFWASYCGPCIEFSKNMIPIYEEFKDKGFIICGVARETKDTHQMKKRLEKDKYPWVSLVELDDQNKIWEKYGISAGAGGIFLLDDSGLIIKINPSLEQVKDILTKRLK